MLKEQKNLLDEQMAVRRERARKEKFEISSKGRAKIFTDFKVENPATGGEYKVAIRGFSPGDNYCSCPDFRKNALGTCKHIEAVLLHLEKTVSKKRLAGKYVPRVTEVYVHYGAELAIRVTPARDAGSGLHKSLECYFTPEGIFRAEMMERFPKFLDEIEHLDDEVTVYGDVMALVDKELDLIEGRKEETALKKRMKDAAFFRSLVSAKLYPYQKEGVVFLACRRRAILGDDMGLGKTVQAIGAVRLLMNTGGVEKVLTICPASLKHQWKKETERFTDLEPVVVEGNVVSRRRLYRSGIKGWLITTYDTVRRDVDLISEWAPDLIILDEAQRIKNWETATAKSVKELRSRYAFVLTGTPMENKLDELFSIVEFVDDRRLGPAYKFLADHTVLAEDSKTRITGYRDLNKIREKLAPILLRRSKREVLLQLPERTDNMFYVPMSEQQRVPYIDQREIAAKIAAKWARHGWLSELDHRRLLCALTNMRMLCDSTYLFDKETNFSPKLEELRTIIGELVEEGRKVVLFSQWTRMLEKVAEVSLNGYRHVYLHGGVPSAKRGDLIRRFWEDDKVKVFLSSDAGGVGLNLQAGSAIINVDVPWNPAVLEQRIGRVHRMGQDKTVLVINMVTEGSIEERILGIIRNKKALFDGVFEGTCDEVDFRATAKPVFRELVEDMTAGAPPAPEPEDAYGEEETEEAEAGGVSILETTGIDDGSVVGAAGMQAAELGALFNIGKNIFAALAGSIGSNSDDVSAGPVRVVRDAATGARKMNIELPADDALKNSLRQIGQFLVNIGS